jgi:hypothetical protein
MKNYTILMTYLVLIGAASSMPLLAVAGERESLEQLRATTLSLINALVDQGVLAKDKADTLIKQAEAAKLSAASGKDGSATANNIDDGGENVVHVQYVPDFVKKQLRDEIKQEVMAKAQSEGWAYPGSIPDWLNRIEWEGDLRLRYERDSFNNPVMVNGTPLLTVLQTNPFRNVPSSNLDNVNEDRNRYRLRARLAANVNVNSWLAGGIRLTTGSTSDPVSPNQTEGISSANGSSSAKYSFALDRAFLKAQVFPWLSVTGGRFANPFFSTDLVWDPDLAFDGVAGNLKAKFNDKLNAFGTIGAFPLDEIQTNSSTNLAKSKWLYGVQGGINWKAMKNTDVKVGLAYYDYENVAGIANTNSATPYSATAPAFRQKGNNVFDLNAGTTNSGSIYGLVNDFREINLTGQIDYSGFSPAHIILTGDYVVNAAFDKNRLLGRAAPFNSTEDTGFQVKLLVGSPETTKANQWNVFAVYKRLEADAVLDAYTDSDFHLGGTDTKGYILGANYGIDKNTWLTARWFSADEISGPLLAIDVLMLDLNAKF